MPTHSELCDIGVMILRDMIQCDIYGRDVAGARSGEHADCIGWQGHESTVIECKVSIKDLNADSLKGFRRPGAGVGNYRLYLFTPEVPWMPQMLPAGWGVYVLRSSGPQLELAPERLSPDTFVERSMLLSLIRKERREQPMLRDIRGDEWLEDAASLCLGIGMTIRGVVAGTEHPFRDDKTAERVLKDHIRKTHDIRGGRAVERTV